MPRAELKESKTSLSLSRRYPLNKSRNLFECIFDEPWGPFLESPEKFSHPESHSKISNLVTTELFNAMIFLICTEVLFIQSFGPICFSVFKIQITKNVFTGPKSFQGFREMGPRQDDVNLKKKLPTKERRKE